MAITAFLVGFIGGMFLCLVNPAFGAAWFSMCILVGVLAVLDKIQSLLERQQKHVVWYEKLEAYRFEKQYPDAAREWREAEAAKAPKTETEAESAERTQQQLAKVEAERQAKREAKRKAAEPTFVSQELVPEIPPEFKPQSDVDFSALEEVAKPRRRRE